MLERLRVSKINQSTIISLATPGGKSALAIVRCSGPKVKEIIIDKLGVDESEVVADANFTNDLGADSLDTVELIMEFEKEFNIAIPDEQAENIQTVGQAIKYIEENK